MRRSGNKEQEMTQNPAFEIPSAMRDMAERNVEQARNAYGQFLEAARQAQELVSRSSEAMTAGVREVNEAAMRFTAQNMDASFTFARDLAQARDLKEALEMQQTFAQRQMDTYAQQAQELTRLMADAAQRAQPKR